jgi:uncharacterized membrane protein YphA (DoxX/SURF4 family)
LYLRRRRTLREHCLVTISTRESPAPAAFEARHALAVIRIGLGLLFVWVFFENLNKGLYTPKGYADLIQHYVTKGQAPDAWKAVMSLMAANAAVAAPVQAVTEITFGILLVAGALSRPVALAAALFLTSLWISEWGTAWIWELLFPMIAAFALAGDTPGRTWGVDGWLARRFPRLPFW